MAVRCLVTRCRSTLASHARFCQPSRSHSERWPPPTHIFPARPPLSSSRGCAAHAAPPTASEPPSAVEPVSETLTRLRSPGLEVNLVGTAHISRESADEVRQLIRRARPDVVFVELCEPRARDLLEREARTPWQVTSSLLSALLSGRPGGVFKAGASGMYLALELFGFKPGAELRTAILEGRAVGARVVYGDQPIATTMDNLSARVTVSDLVRLAFTPAPPSKDLQPLSLCRLVGGGGASVVEQMKRRDTVAAMVAALESSSPTVAEVMLHDRDRFMAARLRELRGNVVAVVGLAHMAGIERLWQRWAEHPGEAPALAGPQTQVHESVGAVGAVAPAGRPPAGAAAAA